MALKRRNDRIDNIEMELLEMLLKDLQSLAVENDMNDCSEYLYWYDFDKRTKNFHTDS